ncbi:MAG: 16S rRNA (uracil(1498)-N(3))-methyltransferase [bacterium]
MPRREVFYSPPEHFHNEEIILTGDEHRHLARVLHHRVGERIFVVDGAGLAAEAEIVSIQREKTVARVIKKMRRYGESFTQITLAQAVPKGSRFDWIVEKATELGVAAIIPLLTARTEAGAKSGKVERWRRLALAAMKQCCRSVWPEIREPLSFEEVCQAMREYNLNLLAHENSGDPLRSVPHADPPRKILLLIGPEGGFTEQEIQHAMTKGCQMFSLGPRRLRADTAGLVAISKVLTALGQMS